MKLIMLFTSIVLLFTSCNAQVEDKNDFIQTTQRLLQLINERDSTAIFKLMWSESAIENKKGDIIKNDLKVINEYLDTIPDIKKLQYNLNIFNINPVEYATVTVPLRQEKDSFKIQVYFSHPSLKHKGQIRNYDFDKKIESFKFIDHPQIGNTGS